MNGHEHYEELCALAATGQLAQPELKSLKAHLEDCPCCRVFTDDLMQIGRELTSLGAERSHVPVPSGMMERFVARARYENIDMSRRTANAAPTRRCSFSSLALGAAAAVFIIAIFAIWKPYFSSLSGLAVKHPVRPPVENASAPSNLPSLPERPNDGAAAQQQLASTRKQVSALDATIQTQRDELEVLKRTQDALRSQLMDAEKQNINLKSEQNEREIREASLQKELEKAKSDKTASDVALALQESEVRELRKEVDHETEQLRQQEELTARGSDVRDLVVARNLHIIDVHDRDSNGKSQRAFGRIFYTEGKSLIFYAYDLGDAQKVEAKVSFCVWGGRLGSDKPIKSLGILHNDDVREGRWVLTFDDPQVLAEIDSVFVTVEPSRKSIHEPGGKRILFAFLGEKPNHP